MEEGGGGGSKVQFEISNITSGEEIVKSTLFCEVRYVLYSGINSYNVPVL
jgi:hypothetical protein